MAAEAKVVIGGDASGAVKAAREADAALGKLDKGAGDSAKSISSKLDGLSAGFSKTAGIGGGAFDAIKGSSLASAAGIGIAAGAVVKFGGQAVAAASGLNEQISKTQAVFGDSSNSILTWADDAATSLGQSKTQALEAASSFGNMFLQLGLTKGAAVDMSKSMTGLATDFASFFNTDPATALEAISAAFRGEFDSVQKFVPTINAAAVEQEALKEGLASTTKELTAQDKATATYHLLLNGAGQATGDFARTSGSLANQQRILKAEIADASAKLGQNLLPALTKLATFASKAIDIIVNVKFPGGGKGTDLLFAGFKVLGDGAKIVQAAWNAIPEFGSDPKHAASGFDAIAKSATDMSQAIGPAGAGFDTFGRAARAAATGFDVLTKSVEMLGTAIGPASSSVGDFTRSAGSAATSLDMVPTSADAAANALARTGSEFGDLKQKSQEAADAINGVHDAISGLNDSQLDSAGLQQQVIEAMQKANEVTKDGTKTTLEKQVADNEAVKSAKSLAENQREIATATSTATTEQGKAVDGQNAYIATLQFIAGSAQPEVKAGIDTLIAAYQLFGQQNPKPTADADVVPATTKLVDAQREADLLDKKRPKPISDADIALAKTKLGDAQRAADDLDKKRPNVVASASTSAAEADLNNAARNRTATITANLVGTKGTLVRFSARGSNFFPGGLSVVGEEGPELVELPRGSKIHTAAQTEKLIGGPAPLPFVTGSARGGGAGTVIQVDFGNATFIGPDKASIGRWIDEALAASRRRGNRAG